MKYRDSTFLLADSNGCHQTNLDVNHQKGVDVRVYLSSQGLKQTIFNSYKTIRIPPPSALYGSLTIPHIVDRER
jgi:hypothetical protein